MQLTKKTFGTFQHQDVTLFTLSNHQGMEVKLMNYGATITSIRIPSEDGKKMEIACGFDTFEGYFSDEYKQNAPYFGATVGRYCSQIKDANFTLNGKKYQLASNCGNNNLHGGNVGFDKKMWKATAIETDHAVGVAMSLTSKDMEEGFPGDVEVTVKFMLTDENEISIEYQGVPNQDTPLSLTNHTYFNLSGFKENILNHKVTILANKKQECDETGAATGKLIELKGTADDLNAGELIGKLHEIRGAGFENFYITETGFSMKKVAMMEYPENKIKLEVSTMEPCMLFYSGIYTSDNLKRENGDHFGKYRGFCFETHRYQNGPNLRESPKTITKAGETFYSKTIFKLTF